MQSLAVLVLVLFVAMLDLGLMASIIAWRSQTRRWRIAAVIMGVPSGIIGAQFLTVGTPGAIVFGLLGIAGLAFPLYRLRRWKRDAHVQIESETL